MGTQAPKSVNLLCVTANSPDAAPSGERAVRQSRLHLRVKHDGFRAVVCLQQGECKLISSNSKTLRFGSLTKMLAKLSVQNVILDGEIVCLDDQGVSQFDQLFSRKGPHTCAEQVR